MEPRIQFCKTSDGVRIAYSVEGEGPALLVCPELVESLALVHLVPGRAAFLKELGRGRRLVRYDTRGTGLSEREVEDVSLAALVRDIEAVVARAGLEGLAIYATLAGGPRAISFAAEHPALVRQLIVFGAFATAADVMPRADMEIFAELARSNWRLGAETIANLRGRRQIQESNARLAQVYMDSTSGDMLARLLLSNCDVDVTRLLPQVKAQTLVVHYINDRVIPFSRAQRMAELIPDASLVPLDDDSPYPDALLAAARDFLRRPGELARARPAGDRAETGAEEASGSNGPHETPVRGTHEPVPPGIEEWRLAAPTQFDRLSGRELEVLRLLATGRTNQEIAGELFIAHSTVARHVTHILSKTGASNRAEAAAFAFRRGFVR
jgi:pimeloyl-ACP methyl ester carboxylesterase/DNA-binding CsgD family transcriptional regulator